MLGNAGLPTLILEKSHTYLLTIYVPVILMRCAKPNWSLRLKFLSLFVHCIILLITNFWVGFDP